MRGERALLEALAIGALQRYLSPLTMLALRNTSRRLRAVVPPLTIPIAQWTIWRAAFYMKNTWLLDVLVFGSHVKKKQNLGVRLRCADGDIDFWFAWFFKYFFLYPYATVLEHHCGLSQCVMRFTIDTELCIFSINDEYLPFGEHTVIREECVITSARDAALAVRAMRTMPHLLITAPPTTTNHR
jgi:hypothetical protein